MKNKLLLSSLLTLSILTFSGAAKAQESADATFTGTLSASTEVVKIQDGVATINATTGVLENTVKPLFRVTTSESAGISGIFRVARIAGVPTLNNPDGTNYIALVNGFPGQTPVFNAISENPALTSNPNVIAYEINVRPEGQPDFVFNADQLEGIILNAPGTNDVNVELVSEPRAETFGTNDEAGDYTANLTLTAVGSL